MEIFSFCCHNFVFLEEKKLFFNITKIPCICMTSSHLSLSNFNAKNCCKKGIADTKKEERTDERASCRNEDTILMDIDTLIPSHCQSHQTIACCVKMFLLCVIISVLPSMWGTRFFCVSSRPTNILSFYFSSN